MNQDHLLRSGRFEYLEGIPLGIRRTRGAISGLCVVAGPFAEVDRVVAEACFPPFMTYILKGSVAYIGHGCGERRLGDRLTADELAGIEQVYVVHSGDSFFGKHIARVLECRLWKIADDNGVALANRVRPNGVGREELASAEAREIVREARFLLLAAGCTIFEEKAAARPASTSLGALGVRFVSEGGMPPALGPTLVLDHRGSARARGYAVEGGFLVLPGSDFRLSDARGLDRHNRERRDHLRQLKKNFSASEGDRSKATLTLPMICASRAMAAKVLTGAHLNSSVWKAPAERADGQCVLRTDAASR